MMLTSLGKYFSADVLNGWVVLTQTFKTSAEKYLPSDVSIILFTDENIFAVAASKNLQNDWQTASAATKKKLDAIKRLRKRLTSSHWRHQLASHKWLAVHQSDICRSRSQD